MLGYGRKNAFVPPIRDPTWLVNEIDRFLLTIETPPFITFMTAAFLRAVGTGDALSGAWYNNAAASGQ